MTQDAQNVKLPVKLTLAAEGIPATRLAIRGLELVRAGLSIFPCVENGKAPACPHGFKDASDDEAVILEWLRQDPNYNWGCAPEDQGWHVIDLDVKDGKDGPGKWRELCIRHSGTAGARETRDGGETPMTEIPRDLYPTWTRRTPSGGQHLIYAGRGPSTAGRLGEGVDTRGAGGYIVLEGVINGRWYETARDLEIAELPAWVSSALGGQATKIEVAMTTQLDLEVNIIRARQAIARDLTRFGVPTIGQGSDTRAYRIGAELCRDHGISRGKAVDLLKQDWAPHFDHDYISLKMGNAGRYGQNVIGAYAVNPDTFADAAAQITAGAPAGAVVDFDTGNDFDARVKQFLGRSPAEGAKLPPIEFLDPYGFFPVTHDGSAGYVYGTHGSLKTVLVALLLLRRIKADLDWNAANPDRPRKVLRVLYSCGEGRHGVETSRIPSLARQVGVSLEDLGRYWRTTGAAPNLTNGSDVGAYIAAARIIAEEHFEGEHADAIVFDTEATVSGGLSENDDALGKLILENGPVGIIKRAIGSRVHILVAHTGKTEGRHLRGHSSREDNSDFGHELKFEHDGAAGKLSVWVEKQKDGEDKFTVEFPVIVRPRVLPEVGEGTRDGKTGTKASKEAADWKRLPGLVGRALKSTGIRDPSLAVTTKDLMARLRQLGSDMIDGAGPSTLRNHLTGQKKVGKMLERRLAAYVAPRREGDDWRWYFPEGEIPEPDED